MGFRSSVIIALVAGVLAGCSKTAGFNDAAAVEQIRTHLVNKSMSVAMMGTTKCAEYFDVGQIDIKDKQPADKVVKVSAVVQFTPKQDISSQALLNDMCYGSPHGNWVAGKAVYFEEHFAFEKWDSGWRLSTNPLLQ